MKCENIKIEELLTYLNLSIDQFNKLINDKYGFVINWKQYSNYWKSIQHFLPNGYRICPKCGIILKRQFRSHLLQHGIQPKQWYNELHGYEYDPVCPTCKKHILKFIDKQLQYKPFCCRKCSNLNMTHHKNRSNAHKKYISTYGTPNSPETWTDEQIKNRGYSGRNDENYKKLVDELQLRHDNIQYASQLKIKRHISYKRTKKRNSKILGHVYFPESWTNEQIQANGFLGKDDILYQRLVDDVCKKRRKNSSKAGKANNIKNGSNCAPGSWTDEQIKNRGYSGRNDPIYLKLVKEHKNTCSLAGKENVKKYGFFGAPGSWTDEQIKNRGYSGRDDQRYIDKCKQKTEWSKNNGHITQKKYGCKLYGWGYKVDFIYNDAILYLDSLYELWFMLFLIHTMPNEMLLNNQHYYSNTTNKFNGVGARSDIRTININTGIITNWEIHNINDIDGINRKKFCTELHNEIFQLISFNDIKYYVNQLKILGYDINKIRFEAQHSNCILHKPYKFTYKQQEKINKK